MSIGPSLDDFENVLFNNHERFKLIEKEYVDLHRWDLEFRVIVWDVINDCYLAANYREPATEMQDHMDDYYPDESDWEVVSRKQKMVTVFE